MTKDELECVLREVKDDFEAKIKSNFVWTKWILSILVPAIISFGVFTVKELSTIKENFVTKLEFQKANDNLKLEITKRFSLPVQISQAQLKQIRAILDKNQKEYQQAKEDEYRLNQEMFRMNYDITTRGGESHEPK
jgi:hypothetical protein